jgi:hypothetical protein
MMMRVLTAGTVMGAAAAALTLFAAPAAMAQQAPTCQGGIPAPPTGCGPLDFTTTLNNLGTATATVTINGQVITIFVDPQPPGPPNPTEVTATSITGLSTAIGTNFTVQSKGPTPAQGESYQTQSGAVTATTTITTLAPVPGLITSISNAFGNTAQAEVCCGGMNVDFVQTVTPTATITAQGDVSTVQGLGTLAMSSTATANVIGASAVNGPINLRGTQDSGANVNSWSRGAACCNTGSITVGSTAAANSLATSSTTSTVYTVANQTNTGYVSSTSDHWTNSGRIITSATQATGNSVTMFNQWGYTDLRGSQTNNAPIVAEGYLTANNYVQSANVGATGQANSAILSSEGSDGLMDLVQYNGLNGGVAVLADFNASSPSGGVGTATATAAGNSLTAYACSSCGQNQVKLEGFTTQTNEASVSAAVTMGAATGGTLLGQATAVGNSANFIIQTRSN